MGYTTDFEGHFTLDKELTPKLKDELIKFAETRHGGNMHHHPDKPGFWCQWVPTQDGKGICWDGSEKFYEYIQWLEYVINNFLKPAGYVLNGAVQWRGEEFSDLGTIHVFNNKVTTGDF